MRWGVFRYSASFTEVLDLLYGLREEGGDWNDGAYGLGDRATKTS